MRLALLGPVELTDDTRDIVAVPSRRQRQLLVILGTNVGTVMSADWISELTWGSNQPSSPAGNVQTNVSRLRRLLQPPLAIETSANGYKLVCPDDCLDVKQFERLVHQVRRAPAKEVPDLATEALSLWRGLPFGDVDHPDIDAERQRLTELRLDVADFYGEALANLGRHHEAIEVSERLVREHPYRERPVATLMRSLYATGRQADALGAFGDLRTRLLEDLGVDPSAELRDLELAVLEQSLPAEPPRAATLQTKSVIDQQIRICTTADGTRLAYAVSGSGPPLVKAASWMTHLDYDWESPIWRHWNTVLSRNHTLVRYDERGCGLSDRDVDRFTFEAWVDDLASVVDAVGLDRFPLLGISQGERWRSHMRCDIPTGSAGWCSSVPTHAAVWSGP